VTDSVGKPLVVPPLPPPVFLHRFRFRSSSFTPGAERS